MFVLSLPSHLCNLYSFVIFFYERFNTKINFTNFLYRWFCHSAPQRCVCAQGSALKRRQRHDLVRGSVHRFVCSHRPRHQAVDRCHHCRTLPVCGAGWHGEYLSLRTTFTVAGITIETEISPLSPSSCPPWSTSATRDPGWCSCCRTSACWAGGVFCCCYHFMRRESASKTSQESHGLTRHMSLL